MKVAKWQMAVIVAAGVALGSTLSVAAQESPPTASEKPQRPPGQKMAPAATEKPQRPPGPKSPQTAREKPKRPPGHKMDGPNAAFRAEFALPGKDGGPVVHVRIDRGVLKTIQDSNLVITTPEGDVAVPTSSETKVSRDGQQSTLADLKAGDHVMTHRSDRDGSMATVHVKAISPERYAEREAMREKCKSDPAACKEKMQQRRGNKRPPGGPAGPA